MSQVTHKTETGRDYKGIAIHAAGGVHEAVADVIRKLVPQGAHILELAAGSGAMTSRLLDSGYYVTPVDLDGSTWQCSACQLIIADFNRPDWMALLPDRQYDAVVAMEVVEHLDNPRQFITSLNKLVSSSGFCIVTTPNVFCPESLQIALRNSHFFGFDGHQYYVSGHLSIVPWWMIEIFFRESGLEVISTSFVGRLDKSGVRRVLSSIFRWIVNKIRKTTGSFSDDGIVSIVIGKRKH